MKLTYKGEVMKTLLAVLIALGLLVAIAMPVSAAWKKDDIAELVAKVKKGEGFIKSGDLSSEQKQIISFYTYRIDIKAQLCFSTIRSYVLVPCEALKKGYPIFASLITWVK